MSDVRSLHALILMTILATLLRFCLAHSEVITVPLGPRLNLKTSNGKFDKEKAIAHHELVKWKYQKGLSTLKRNLNMTTDHTIEHHTVFPKRESLPLQMEDDGSEWVGSLSIGTPAQPFSIDFDTGSSDLWVFASDCEQAVCDGRHKYTTNNSTTSKIQPGSFYIQYGDESEASGPIYTDTVSIANLKAVNQAFSSVNNLSSEFAALSIDGVCGLAYESISLMKRKPLMSTLWEQGSIKENMFAFKLSSIAGNSSLSIGGTDPQLYNGEIEYHPVISKQFWRVGEGVVHVNDKEVTAARGFKAIIDSGTSIMYGPSIFVLSFYTNVLGAKLVDDKNGFYAFPCTNVPTVQFSFGGRKWEISKERFNLGELQELPGQCVGALSSKELGLPWNTWLLGDSFMMNMYTVFSFAKNSVGFAELS